jgi:uncharacterized repeat protein (TIGR03803 family)
MRVNLLCAMAAAIAVMGEAPAWGAAGTQTALWSFTGGADGNQPRGDILIGANGLLYGTASSGGINQCGTVFQIKPTGT